MTTLTEFAANLRDVARPNRFTCEFRGNIRRAVEAPDNLKYMIHKATIPKLDINGPVMKYRGTTMMLRGDYKKDPLSLSFHNESRWKVRTFFEEWMAYSIDFDSENRRKSMQESRFGASVIVTQYGPGLFEPIAAYEYLEVTPFEISEIALDQLQADVLEEFTVSFQYAYWINLGLNGATATVLV